MGILADILSSLRGKSGTPGSAHGDSPAPDNQAAFRGLTFAPTAAHVDTTPPAPTTSPDGLQLPKRRYEKVR